MKRASMLWTILGAIIGVFAVIAALVVRRVRCAPAAQGRVTLLDIPVDPLTMAEALTRVEAFITAGGPHHIFTADASGIARAQEDRELFSIIGQADLVTADGAGVLLASRIAGARLPERVSGCDLVMTLCALAAARGYAVYFFGAAEGVAHDAAAILQERFPGLRVAGVRNGYYAPEDEARIARDIAVARPEILFVALGVPKQERFIRGYFEELGVPVMLGVGGSLDVIAGRLQRAPRWMQRTGLEWLYRLLQEPQRLPRMLLLPQFILQVWRWHGTTRRG